MSKQRNASFVSAAAKERRNHPAVNDKWRWKAVRRRVLSRANYRCAQCGKAGAMEVDHILPIVDYPDFDPLDLGNLQALDRGCHIRKSQAEHRVRVPIPDETLRWRVLYDLA